MQLWGKKFSTLNAAINIPIFYLDVALYLALGPSLRSSNRIREEEKTGKKTRKKVKEGEKKEKASRSHQQSNKVPLCLPSLRVDLAAAVRALFTRVSIE